MHHDTLATDYRTHTCGSLRRENIGETVQLSGWVNTLRNHGQLIFIDLRDRYGLTQCLVDASSSVFEKVSELKHEDVIQISGNVVARSEDTRNSTINTGEIEIAITRVDLLSSCDPLPFQVNSDGNVAEELRLRYRFIDLRRKRLQDNMLLRAKMINAFRTKLTERGFVEFQTPILTASSREDARDFLVPSRIHPGTFFALPQSPQQFKQLLMIAGFDRYFQIAPCFRDEAARADRSPGEHYQVDLEMSFVTQENVFSILEPILYEVFTELGSKTVSPYPFRRIKYREAMLTYGVR